MATGFTPKVETLKNRRPVSLPDSQWKDFCDATLFQTRKGPNYKKNRLKGNSAKELFELAGCDFFSTRLKVDHIAEIVTLPLPKWYVDKYEGSTETNLPDPYAMDDGMSIPPIIIIQIQLPTYCPPPIWGPTKRDGGGITLVMYFSLTGEARKEWKNNEEFRHSKDLIERFCMSFSGDPLLGALKCIPKIANADELDVSSFTKKTLNSYNAKPFLTGPTCHRIYTGTNYMEIDIDGHLYAYLAKKACWGFLDILKDMTIDIGLTVEAREEEELPEQIFACCRVKNMDSSKAKNLKDVYDLPEAMLQKWKDAPKDE